MAEQKPTSVPSPSFSTILPTCGINQLINETEIDVGHLQQDAHLKRIQGKSRKDYDAALSLHLYGDLQ